MPRRETAGMGTLVRQARERMGWTQSQVADQIGVDKGYISSIEIGTRRWPLQHIPALAELLGLDYVEMAIAAGMMPEEARKVRRDIDSFPDGDPAREVVARLHDMGIEEREQVLTYTKFVSGGRAVKSERAKQVIQSN